MRNCGSQSIFENVAICPLLAGCTIALVVASSRADETDSPTARIVGTVTVVGTNELVAGATIRALDGKNEMGSGYTMAETSSDLQGRYELGLPMGHTQLTSPTLPPGYWCDYEPICLIATTPNEPEYTKHYQVQRGPIWRVRIETDEESARFLPDITLVGSRFTSQPFFQGQGSIDESGNGSLTFPEEGGEYHISFYDSEMRVQPRAVTKLSIESGFQPQSVADVRRSDEGSVLVFVDESGRRATLTDAEGGMVDGQAEIRIRATLPSREDSFSVTGRVIDDDGNPIVDAIVAMGNRDSAGGGSAMTRLNTRSDQSGSFTISRILRANFESRNTELFLVVRRDGYAGVDTPSKSLTKDDGHEILDFGTVTLSPGHKAKLRILDADGRPALGAWIEPGGGYAPRAEFGRTDAGGRCTIGNLAVGIQEFGVRFGEKWANAKVVVLPDESDEAIVRLQPPVTTTTPTTTERRTSLTVGEEAPEWEVVGWTDGAQRRLSDYRGQVVVLDMWGIWCSACLNGLPALKEVERRFRDRDVVFLSIHTAGTQLNQVRKLLDLKEWNWPAGLDTGDDINSGTTVQRYRVCGYPTTIIVGRDGRVAFTTDHQSGDREAVMNAMAAAAEDLDIPWPPPSDMTPKEGIPLMNRILAHILTTHIEAALGAE